MRAVLQNARQAVACVDVEARITFANDYLLSLTGYSADEIAGLRWSDIFVAPEWRDVIDASLTRALAGEEFAQIAEYPIVAKSGEQRIIRWHRVRLRNAAGEPEGIASIGEDITASRAAESKLSRTKAFYQEILDHVDAGVIVTDRRDGVVYLNGAIRRTWPDLEEEIRESSHYDVLPHVFARLRAAYRRARASGTIQPFKDVELIAGDGTVRTYSGTMAPMRADGDGSGILCTLHDVTDTVATARALRASQTELEAIIDSAPGIVWRANPNTLAFDFISAQVETILGYRPEDCIGDPNFWLSVMHPEDRDRAYAECVTATMAGIPHTLEYRMIAADGRVIWIRDVVKVEMRDGEPVTIFGVITDVTDHRRIEESQRVASLITGVAHEVRNPLNSIQAAAAALELDIGHDPDNAPLLGVIRSQIGRLGRLMNDLLTYAKPANPSMFETHTVSALVADAVQAWGKPERVVVALPDDEGWLHVEPMRFQQVIVNVLENATQHDRSGQPVELIVHAMSGGTHIELRDRGPGIPEQVLPRVFEPFFTTRRGGTGLGLSIVKTIIQEHGGTIELRNHPEGGCVVEIVMPSAFGPQAVETLDAAEAVGR